MKKYLYKSLPRIRLILAQLILPLALPLLITACGVDIENNLPGVPPEGRFVAVAANQHSGENSIEVAVALFDDGEPVEFVGGDVVQASTTSNSVLLLESGFYEGSYAASLANGENLDQVDFLVVHDSLETRQDRWYPIDILNFDPGPGELVGASASISLPPEPVIATLSRTEFTDINDTFVINWLTQPTGDSIKIRSLVTCSDGNISSSYGTEAALIDETDDGTETVGIDQFIYDINDENSTINIIIGAARALLQELLIKLSEGGIDEQYFENLEPLNPISHACEIRLFLYRHRPGSFDSPSVNGNIFGSRSTEATILYNPN